MAKKFTFKGDVHCYRLNQSEPIGYVVGNSLQDLIDELKKGFSRYKGEDMKLVVSQTYDVIIKDEEVIIT